MPSTNRRMPRLAIASIVGVSSPSSQRCLVKVVVEMYGARAAEVRTAHLVKSVTLGEVQLWP